MKNKKSKIENNSNVIINKKYYDTINSLKSDFKEIVDDMPAENFISMLRYIFLFNDECELKDNLKYESGKIHNKKSSTRLRLLKKDDNNNNDL